MWTPCKNERQEQVKDSRMCFTEQKELKDRLSTNQKMNMSSSQLEQTRLKEGRYADGTASMFDTFKVKKNNVKHSYEEMTFQNNGKIYNFPVFNDNQIGFQAISNKIIPTKADEDCKTVSDIAQFGKRICLQDLHEAIDQNQKKRSFQKNYLMSSSTSQSTQ